VYDLLNEVALEAHLAPWKKAEGEMALAHLRWVKPQDIVITDRGYPSFLWLAAVQSVGAHFVSRCSRSSFGQVRRLFARNRAGLSVTVTVWAPKDAKAQCRERGWPTSMKMRFVTVRLSSGELEVLATSLLDQATYPTEEFERLYWCRWGHETYFRRLKGRLDLEHCSGLTVDAVEQDCAAMVLLSNIESVVVGPATAGLRARGTAGRQPLKVNRAVSCHAMKLRLIDLLASNIPAEKVLAELTTWFMDNPVSVRKRKVPRQKFSLSRSYHHQRHVRKIVF